MSVFGRGRGGEELSPSLRKREFRGIKRTVPGDRVRRCWSCGEDGSLSRGHTGRARRRGEAHSKVSSKVCEQRTSGKTVRPRLNCWGQGLTARCVSLTVSGGEAF